MKDLIHELLTACMERSEKTDDDAFFGYSPHIGAVSVHIYDGGYDEDRDHRQLDYIYLNQESAERELRSQIDEVKPVPRKTPLSHAAVKKAISNQKP